ncbi:rhomboid family intramembrane serine protease [Flaviaesturariibacter amylovorans]|uniref:Rhomboid family intramembrane serine protease n=1 Tax=Flaviaesturariibacter amylovorans TaxID=1084520 RepID=A0ABP8HUH7_9BACT
MNMYYRPNNFPPLIKNLMIINALVYLVQVTVGKKFGFNEHGTLYPIMPKGLLAYVQEQLGTDYVGFQPYQIATHMFMHSEANFLHLVFNMFMLWSFGRQLESLWGPKRFLFFYLACGVGAAALHLGIQSLRCFELWDAIQSNPAAVAGGVDAISPMLGASGAVMGVLAGYAFLFPNTEMSLLFIPFPIKAKWYVLGVLLMDVLGWLNFTGQDNIAHLAHLGGAATGALLVFYWNKTGRRRFY